MYFDVLDAALGFMRKGPSPFAAALAFSAQANWQGAGDFAPGELMEHLGNAAAGDDTAGLMRRTLARWDNDDEAWAAGTPKNTADRRRLVYQLLGLEEAWVRVFDTKFQFRPIEQPTVIATEHAEWYTDEVRRARHYYWSAYQEQLRRQGWMEDSLLQLDDSTNRIVERLANPADAAAFQSKGLVVGYVQSGKTANFTGVIAKAADAGYKLIIVLAGLLDALRTQTQRRVDKDLIGQELLDRDYINDRDWNDFLSHGRRPSEVGAFDWYRLTGPDGDYQSLRYGLEALKFDVADEGKPLWHKDNLFRSSTRIAIVKKNSIVVQRLVSDLNALAKARFGAPLDQIPTLIIDDESDQASINTQRKVPIGVIQKRTTTNAVIVRLLQMLPRAQYVGYTATPFANVFVDPNNEEDIFPKDFLISLPRPVEYMGVQQFYDLDGMEDDEESRPNERDYIRKVVGPDENPDNLLRAIDAFVLSGALKLFREEADPTLRFRHHTMLIHVNQLTADHRELAKVVRAIYGAAGYDGGPGLDRLKALFKDDFQRVYEIRGEGLPFPKRFEDLAYHLGECLVRVGEAQDAVLVLNSDKREVAPDFDKQSVWKIIVGGTKLSRGYTVEGLTISYYRRRAGAADTLMQMGRWFGFRRGYLDLVRLFIGRAEPIDKSGKKTLDLYKAFGAACRDEEQFRQELRRYSEFKDPRITPAQIPPLVPQHMLRPTAANKMYNAVVTFRNFGGSLSEATQAPTKSDTIIANNELLDRLVGKRDIQTHRVHGTLRGAPRTIDINTAVLDPKAVVGFLKAYRWYDAGDPEAARRGVPMQLQIEYLEGKHGDPEIDDWLLIGPKIDKPRAARPVNGVNFDVVYRSRHEEAPGRFQTFNDPKHRDIARFIAGQTEIDDANEAFRNLRRPRRAALIYYPITETETGNVKPPFTVGFTLLFPPNGIRQPLAFTVRRQDKPSAAVITV